jgi:uncharacterized protein YbjT (DUF2867 family)
MIAAAIRTLFACVLLSAPVVAPVFAQDSTEPPPPKSSPIRPVMEESLPRAGGILVFGGTQGTGLETVKELVARNENVTVMVRATSDTTALKALGVNLVVGDALDPESVKQAFTAAPFRAAISVLGGHNDYRVDGEGNKNVIDGAKNAGIPRLVLVTSLGAGDSAASAPWYLSWALDLFMKDYMAAKTAAEDHLRATDLDYTIIRPGWLLSSTKPGGTPALVPETNAFSWITRADLGKLVAASVEDESTFKKVLTAFDASRSSVWDILF